MPSLTRDELQERIDCFDAIEELEAVRADLIETPIEIRLGSYTITDRLDESFMKTLRALIDHHLHERSMSNLETLQEYDVDITGLTIAPPQSI